MTRHVQVDGMRLRVRIRGSGLPLLLIMGIGGSIEMWDPLVAALEGFETIAVDAPGNGRVLEASASSVDDRPRARLRGAGHLFLVERPSEAAMTVRDFLRPG